MRINQPNDQRQPPARATPDHTRYAPRRQGEPKKQHSQRIHGKIVHAELYTWKSSKREDNNLNERKKKRPANKASFHHVI